MTRDQAVEWFWRTCPSGCHIELVMAHLVQTTSGPVGGWVYVGDDGAQDLGMFLKNCAVVADETWSGSIDHDSELVEFVRSAVLSAYGRTDACRVTVQR